MSLTVALLLTLLFCYQATYSALQIKNAWKYEITHDWENLNHKNEFKNWQKQFDKKYTDLKEEAHRFTIFLDNWKMINEFNIARNRNFTLRLNQFGDLTGNEFQFYIHGHLGSCLKKPNHTQNITIPKQTILNEAESIDWTNYQGKNYVTPVKNQGQCGSCWAFSATGSIESRTAITTQVTGSEIIELSEQQLVDCSSNSTYHNAACNGGMMNDAFRYVVASGGLCTEKEYPYKAKKQTCRESTCGEKYYPITGYESVSTDSEPSLVTALQNGPVSIAIEADQSAFQFYSSGILDGLCGTRLDHGVLAVGYGKE
eukprot:173516_1